MKKMLIFILLTYFSVVATPCPVYSSSENYKVLVFDEIITVLDDLSVHVQLNYAFVPLIEERYYFDTWSMNIHTADAHRISVENECGPLQFEQAVEGNWTLLTIDLGRKVYANQTYLLKISFYADDRVKVSGSEKSLRMWTLTDNAYKENVTLTVNIPQGYGLVQYEPSFLVKRQSAEGIQLSGEMLGVSSEEHYYLDVQMADTVVHYNVTYEYTFTNEGSKTENSGEFTVPGSLEWESQEVLHEDCTPPPDSISIDESGNRGYKFVMDPIDPGGQKTITMHVLLRIRLSPDYDEYYSVQLEDIPSNLLQYTTADTYWEVDDPTIISLSKNLTEGEIGVINKVRAIHDFVVDNIEYDYEKYEKILSGEETEKYGAITTHNLRMGVCSDYSDLFVTLCRASGIPALVVTGFVYKNDGQFSQAANAHGWAEVFIPEYGWLPVDPTWNLFGKLEGRHISELIKRDSSEVDEVRWLVYESFSYDMKYNVTLLENIGILIPDISVSSSYVDETSFNNDVNLGLMVQNDGNGTAYSTNVTVSVPDELVLLNESIYSLGKLHGKESLDLNLFMRASSIGNASVEVTIEYQTSEGEIKVQQYLYDISIMKSITTVSCSVDPTDISVADNIGIQGSTSPSCPDKNIILTFIKPDGEALTKSIITGSDGSFYFSFAPEVIGSWTVTSSWEGDEEYEGATSSAVHFMVTKIPSIISIQTSESQLTEGESITVSGSITPAVSGADVIISYTNPDGSASTGTVSTGSDGSFSDSHISTETGSWSVVALWQGDSTHRESISETLYFSVVEPEPEQKGIPGFPLISVIIGILAGAAILGLQRTLKP